MEKNILSEQTKEMTPEQIEQLQDKIEKMTEEQLREYRNTADADNMGFCGEESVNDESTKD